MFIFFFLFSNDHSLLTQNEHDYHALQSILYSINHKEYDCIEASMTTKDIQ